uniref:Uncharacterized protein n=1 Tax=Nelumbo nucifera TaxID=4432 RepID=A0A822YSS9_NELNU|nr:TPA_asm: hypothetical protein HUJ06_011129 [Nelumbo nucifera]
MLSSQLIQVESPNFYYLSSCSQHRTGAVMYLFPLPVDNSNELMVVSPLLDRYLALYLLLHSLSPAFKVLSPPKRNPLKAL